MSKFKPYVLLPTMGTFRNPVVVCRESFFGAVIGVALRGFWFSSVNGIHPVVERLIEAQSLPGGINPTYKLDAETPWIKVHSELKTLLLEYGGSPEAVLLLHGLAPFTDKEMNTMAKAATATKVAKKTDAAPKAEKVKGKGNTEALAKARAAKAEAGPDTRKLTITNKENPYREGSNRAASFDALKGAKTVQDYLDAGGKGKYISRWVEEDRISVK